MKKRTAFVGAILSLIPFGQPLLIKTGVVLSTTSFMISLPEKVNANSADFYRKRGIEKFDSGNYYGAISDYTKAIEINPNDFRAFTNRCNAKLEIKDFIGSIEDCTRSIAINSNRYAPYYNRGIAKFNLKDNYGAIADYTKAIEINPNFDSAY